MSFYDYLQEKQKKRKKEKDAKGPEKTKAEKKAKKLEKEVGQLDGLQLRWQKRDICPTSNQVVIISLVASTGYHWHSDVQERLRRKENKMKEKIRKDRMQRSSSRTLKVLWPNKRKAQLLFLKALSYRNHLRSEWKMIAYAKWHRKCWLPGPPKLPPRQSAKWLLRRKNLRCELVKWGWWKSWNRREENQVPSWNRERCWESVSVQWIQNITWSHQFGYISHANCSFNTDSFFSFLFLFFKLLNYTLW